jgi:phage-related protein
MAVGSSRTLKLTILGDVDQLKKSLQSANTDVEQSSSSLGDFSKKAGLAFAAAGVAAAAYAGKLLVDGVKSAIEDEAAQAKLATTLKNVTAATDAQIASTEAFILKTSLATGISDDQLRPSLERLTRATKDVEEAQKLQSLAIDIAAGSGKSLESVSNALAKSAEGQNTALGKLGVGIDAATLKTMSFDEIQKTLAATFGGQAAVAAETFSGKLDRLKVAFDEGKETVGSFVLDAITPMVTYFIDNVVPTIQTLASEIGENLKPTFETLSTFFTDTLIPAVKALWAFLDEFIIPILGAVLRPIVDGLITAFKSVSTAISDNSDKFTAFLENIKPLAKFVRDVLAPAFGTVLKAAFTVIGTLASALITAFGKVAGVIDDVIDAVKSLINLVKNNPIVKGIGGLIDNIFGGGKAAGGPVSGGTSYLVGERGPELFVPTGNGSIIPNNRLGGGSTIINLSVTGAIDSEGTARTIINALNNSFYRGTGGAMALVTS